MAKDKTLNRERIVEELEAVRAKSEDGLLYPKEAVAWARENPESELHGQLEWDDAKAADEYRADQVRGIIRAVVIDSKETPEKVRAYISKPSDRVHGGGYQRVDEALARARAELVNDALRKLATMGTGFTHLPELSPLFEEIQAAVRRFSQAKVAAAA